MSTKTYKKRVEADKVRDQAHGKWLDILPSLVPGYFNNALQKIGTHVTCPFHGGKEDFRFIKQAKPGKGNTREVGVAMCSCGVYPDGFAVLMKATGWTFNETLIRVDEWLNGSSYQETVTPAPIKVYSDEDDEEQNKKILANLLNLWEAGKPLDIKQVPYYLGRGLHARVLVDMQDERFIASLGYYEYVKKNPADPNSEEILVKTGSYPAILAMMRDAQGNPVAVHRTWLSKDKKEKAPVRKAKKLSRTIGAAGAAMRLYDATGADTLGLAEGKETAHSVRQLAMGRYWPELGKIPVWATYSERNIRNFVIPDSMLGTLRKIVIFADNDPNGTGFSAAAEFKERMALEHPEIEVDIKMPEVEGMDWNDVLVNL
ncbi:uncharacterized protein NMK_1987 [Novimethylophilus kurashikiensis]|uniref:Uncharacterized protein n=1 Tax=Novimethylophilus kurashikiensis TaxID=1825523 RepID=A0A2R5FA16_9PROT|nr:toprim domain-containing protein [Novimethylophilus kurashikiensis]GBG14388.1 uncharacterized protein NMK_1987 [Novimethylophilus kurashikiensis]